ncbi:MAG: SDR family oxidoreductase [Halieaceae bacterium]|jgi:short-subunit dehydrogenase|nr:SDR family oxidoreductase [Halieaceae bacterium]
MTKSVLITGATRGLGQALARQFASRGYRLALTGRKQDELDALQRELAAQATKTCTRVLDVTDYDAIPGVLAACAQELDGLDIVVVNAGVGFATPVGTGVFEQVKTTIEVNLTGAMATCEAAIALFREQGGGQLVGITSVAKVRGMRRQGAYSASKAGFAKYLESVRLETWNEPIVVTELAPGYIDTDINRAVEKRPFLVSAEKGTGIMADLIERQVTFRYVPIGPWTVMAWLLRLLPASMLRKM